MNASIRTLSVALIASLLWSVDAEARKKKNKDADAAPAAEAEPVPDTPGDATSKKFAKKLLAAEISNFKPSDGGGARFIYSTLKFNGDNTWIADGYVEIQDERMECNESGTWAMDAAESDNVALVTWKIAKTDCPGRDSGGELRVKMTILKSGGIDVLYR